MNFKDVNLRDKGAALWEGWDRPRRTSFVIALIALVIITPFAGNFAVTSILDTPIASV